MRHASSIEHIDLIDWCGAEHLRREAHDGGTWPHDIAHLRRAQLALLHGPKRNGARLEVWFDRLNIRPYANTLLIRVGRGYMRAGDTVTVRFGDRRKGSLGYRLQDRKSVV